MMAQANTSYVTSNLGLLVNPSGYIIGLTNRLTGVNWLSATSGVYCCAQGLTTSVAFTPLTNGEIQVTLTMTNSTASSVSVGPTFPLLQNLYPGATYGTLTYCFPQEGKVSDTATGFYNRYYGGDFPLQFMDVYDGSAGGIYVMTHDLSDAFRTYEVNVATNSMEFEVAYASQTVQPGASWVLSYVIGAHTGDWHAALAAYRNWVATWYAPLLPRKSWFQDLYNFREMFLYTNTDIGNTGGYEAYNPTTQTYSFSSLLAQDQAAFGGDDYVHLFDWSHTPSNGWVGDYTPWAYLGGVAAFSNQVAQMQAVNIPVGLYFQGYELSKESTVGQAYGSAWQLLNAQGVPYTSQGSDTYYACPDVPAWTNYITGACLAAISNCAANGVYMDSFGFGWQYLCYDSDHGHIVPSDQVQAEGAMMRQLRLSLPASTVLYSEERSVDVNSQYQDGSFTYWVGNATTNDNPSRLNLPRFALPDYKVFDILNVDNPVGNNPQLYMSVFFNGEGIWLEGSVTNTAWFPTNVCSVITQTHAILRSYADAFRSTNPTPLVATLNTNIYANQFPGANRTVWTLYNAGSQTVTGEILMVTNKSNYRFYDAWNNQFLAPRISGTNAYLTLTILPSSAGCVVQEDYKSVVLADNPVGYWRLDESVPPGNTATNLGSLGAAANGLYGQGVTGGASGAIAGDSDTAASFNGVSGHIQVPFNAALNSGAFTIECWAKPISSAPSNYMAVMGLSQNFALYAIPGTPCGNWAFWTGNGTGWNTQNGTMLLSNQWSYLVGTYDGVNQSFYINGTLVTSAPKIFAGNSSNSLLVGAGGTAANMANYFAGAIDEVAVYTNALSPAKIATHYSVGPPLYLSVQQGPSVIIINWNAGTLQQASRVSGPWSNVTGSVSPFNVVVTPTNQTMFYRAKQ